MQESLIQRAEEMVLVLVNDSSHYDEVCTILSDSATSYVDLFDNLRTLVSKGNWPTLVTYFLWEHYREDFKLPPLPTYDLRHYTMAELRDKINKYLKASNLCQEITLDKPTEKPMNQFANTPVTKVTLKPVQECTEDDFLSAIRRLQAEIKGYEDIKGSSMVDAKVLELTKSIKRITKLMDESL